MLKRLQIQNFKGWQDTGLIKMAPITLFFGANSSGKSSIGQFLMMLKQTAESPDRKAVFYPGGKNSAVQLGSYQEMVLHRDEKNQIIFGYMWDTADDIMIRDPITGQKFNGKNIEFKATVGVQDKNRNASFVDNMKYTIFGADNDTALKIGMKKKKNESQYKVESSNYKLIRNPGRVWEPGCRDPDPEPD